mgnify:CR=1 FL=1
MRENGRACEVDYRAAVKHYKLAAEDGNRNAMYNLGFCYVRGRGTEEKTEWQDIIKDDRKTQDTIIENINEFD